MMYITKSYETHIRHKYEVYTAYILYIRGVLLSGNKFSGFFIDIKREQNL